MSAAAHRSSHQKRVSYSPNVLVPGLPDSVVLDCVLPRVPWHTRPVLVATSRAWKQALRDPSVYRGLTRRAAGPGAQGLAMVHQVSDEESHEFFRKAKILRRMPHPHALSIHEEKVSMWRKLPPIPAFSPLRILHDCGVACVHGKLFVMGGWDPRTDAVRPDVYMLDLAGGLWQWEKRSPMHTAKAFFFCKAAAGKIYVVGGSSSQNAGLDEEPLPEVYDVDTDTWELLPKISLSRSFHFNGLALIAGSHILAYGFCTAERGELVSFWRVYDPVSADWSDYDCDLDSCSRVLAGDHDLRDGIINKFDRSSRKWVPMAGKVSGKSWRWEGGQKVLSDSTCAHSLLVVSEASKPHVYATICEGDKRCLTIWRGDLDYYCMSVFWRQIELPGNLSMCSEMCYLRS